GRCRCGAPCRRAPAEVVSAGVERTGIGQAVQQPGLSTSSREDIAVTMLRYADAVSLERLQHALRAFVAERDWAQFHSPENLAKSISIEAAELLEEFQWGEARDAQNVRDELADVLTYCLLMADAIGADPLEIVREK